VPAFPSAFWECAFCCLYILLPCCVSCCSLLYFCTPADNTTMLSGPSLCISALLPPLFSGSISSCVPL
jgi:hypothetical protein